MPGGGPTARSGETPCCPRRRPRSSRWATMGWSRKRSAGAGGGGAWAIAEILPRRSKLARRAPGGGQGERVVAANVDQVVVVFAAAKPEPHPRTLDRFLVLPEGNSLAARVVINKVELVGEDVAQERFAMYEQAGYPTHYTSVKGA